MGKKGGMSGGSDSGFGSVKKHPHAPPTDTTVASVTAVASLTVLEPGQQFTVTMTAKNAEGVALTGKTFTLVSSDQTKVSVDSIVGTTASCTARDVITTPITLTAASSGHTAAAISITTKLVLASVQIAPTSLSLVAAGNTALVSVSGFNRFGYRMAPPSPVAATSNNAVASVGSISNASFLVVPVGQGTASITVRAGGVTSNACGVAVAPQPVTLVPSSYSVTPSTVSADSGDTIGMTAQLLDQNGHAFALAGRVVTWSKNPAGGASTFAAPSSTTDSNGRATVNVNASGNEQFAVVARDSSGCTGQSAQIGVTAPQAPVPVLTGYRLTVSETSAIDGDVIGITAQALDQFGSAFPASGQTLTWSRSPSGASAFSAGTSTTNASGVAAVNMTAAGVESFTIIATDGSGRTGSSPTVSVAASAPPGQPVAEPTFDPSTQTMLYQTDFESYTDAQLNPPSQQGVGFVNKLLVYGTAPSGTNTTTKVVAGRSGGQAMQFQYAGVSQESPGVMLLGVPNTPATSTSVVQYWVKINSLGAPIDANTRAQFKWLMLWHGDPNGNRIQFNTCTGAGGCPYNNDPRSITKWQLYDTDYAFPNGCNAQQPLPPFWTAVADGNWHRITHLVKTNTSPGSRDARALMWIDGILVLRVEQSVVGVDAGGSGTSAGQPWCTQADVDDIIAGYGIGSPEFGGPLTDGVTPFTVAIDDFKWWRSN